MNLPDSPLTRENYFTYTQHEGKPIIHASALEHIYPGQGGSPKRLKMFLDGEMDKPKTSYRTFGSLFHSWMENKNEFVIEPATRPEEGVVKVVTHMFENFPEIRDETGLAILKKIPASFSLLGGLMFESARAIRYQPKWGQEAIVKKISAEGADYWTFLCEAQGHYMLTAKQKDQLEGATQSVKDSQWAEFVFRKDAMHEVPILFKVTIDGEDIWCKALIDWLVMPAEAQLPGEIQFIDYKTTSDPIGNFLVKQRVDLQRNGSGDWVPTCSFYGGPYYYFRYYRQFAFYRIAVANLFLQMYPDWQKRVPDIDSWYLAVESEAPFECTVELEPQEAQMRDSIGYSEVMTCFYEIAGYYKTLKKY